MAGADRQTTKVLVLAALGSIAAVVWAQQLWRMPDWRMPLSWHEGGDALFNTLLAQNIQETGWYQENPRLGAPGTLELYSFPVTILGPMLAFKLLGIAFAAPGAIVNAFYLLGWPLAGLCAAWALLRLGLSPPLAAGFGILFAALPAHAIRGEPHLFLAALALVPPGIVAAHALAREGWSRRGRIWALAFALLLGANEAYYAFFASILVVVAAAIGGFEHRSPRRGLDALAFAAAAVLGIALATLSTLVRGVTSVAERSPADASLLGLKLGQLLMPVISHRFPPFAHLSGRYLAERAAPGLESESVATALGLLASLGLLLLFAHLLGIRLPSTRPETTKVLAGFAIAGFLFATVGGLGSLFVTFVSPQLRAHNRMSVFIAFVALAALGLLLDSFLKRLPGGATGGRAWVCAILLSTFGTWDQSSLQAIPSYHNNAADWASDGDWVGRAEALLAPGAMVFQLPWIPFPESPVQEGIYSFDELRPILRSRSLRWSHGAIKNSPVDLWQRAVVAMPPAEMVTALRAAGFAAVALDRRGYRDSGRRLAQQLQQQLGRPAIVSEDRRWELYLLASDRPGVARADLPAPELFSDSFESGASDRWASPAAENTD